MFTSLLALYGSATGNPLSADDCAAYAERIGDPDFPVMADYNKEVVGITPMTGNTHPEICALAPDMTIIGCTAGHSGKDQALNFIKEHAGQ